MNRLVFDIETGPLPEAELRSVCPPFNPEDVKVGNIKDADKIAAKIKEAEANHFSEFASKAALDARYGRVLAFGATGHIYTGDERDIVEAGLDLLRETLTYKFAVGFNIKAFDLPFLVRRAWKLNVRIPKGIYTNWKGRIQWHENFIDLRDIWQLGDRMAHGSLDTISKHLGLSGKSGSGKDFASLFFANRAAALEYLKKDLELTDALASRML